MSNRKIEDSIFQAIDIIASKRIADAGYDKTIEALVIQCVDATIGKYKVAYQDGYWYAFSTSPSVKYKKGTYVYILIPNGDMSKEKTILGSTKKLGTDFITLKTIDNSYSIVGSNFIQTRQNYNLYSYYPETKVIYDATGDENLNLVNINQTAAATYLKESQSLIISMSIQTELPIEQKYNGNYGLNVFIDFISNASSQEIITRCYTFDINLFEGNPYNFTSLTKQKYAFLIDAANFYQINKIELFVKDFPAKKNNKINEDIFISDINLTGAKLLTTEEKENGFINLTAARGYIFTADDLDTDVRTIQAELRLNEGGASSQNIPYYWFIEDSMITAASPEFNIYGGQGWRCLNQYNIVREDPRVLDFVPAAASFSYSKNRLNTQTTRFKCVAVYGGNIFSKEFTLINNDFNYKITIESDSGTTFSQDLGNPILTCSVFSNGTLVDNIEDFNFVWSVIDNNGRHTLIVEGSDLVTEINGNQLKYVHINQIINFSTFKCSVYSSSNVLIGTAAITLTNALANEDNYTLIINNGNQVFNYNEKGIAPNSLSLKNPCEIPELTFTILDSYGNSINLNKINLEDIEWQIPNTNTMIVLDSENINENDVIYQKSYNLIYDIEQRYDINKINNDISLRVRYGDATLRAKTNFTFIKTGEPGSNGTDIQVKIIPNGKKVDYPIVYIKRDGSIVPNWEPNEFWFNVELWHSGIKIFEDNKTEASDQGKMVRVEWKILQDSQSQFIIDPVYGVIGFDPNQKGSLVNIIEAIITYDNFTYYTTLPVTSIKMQNDNYLVSIQKNTGFNFAIYNIDGTHPNYKTIPFCFKVIKKNEDISLNESISYIDTFIGEITQNRLIQNLEKNQKAIKPFDKIDGSVLNTAYLVDIMDGQERIAIVYIPIHLYLNRYNNANLNEWDGNSINLGQNNGIILTPQIGAGKKNEDNTFSGILFGREKTSTRERVGLLGYSHGLRSVFLDAETGRVELGTPSSGQVIIDPTTAATLKSGDYNYAPGDIDKGKGMLINLSSQAGGPSILFGSGNFEVDRYGYLKAVDGEFSGKITAENGSIGSWDINYKGIKRKNSDDVYFYPDKLKLGTFEASKTGALAGGSGRSTWSISETGRAIFNDVVINSGIIRANVTTQIQGIYENGYISSQAKIDGRTTVSAYIDEIAKAAIEELDLENSYASKNHTHDSLYLSKNNENNIFVPTEIVIDGTSYIVYAYLK